MNAVAGFASRLSALQGTNSARSFARRLDMSEGTYRSLMKNENPTLATLLSIAERTGVSVGWLANEEGPMVPASVPLLPYGADIERVSGDFALVPRLDVQASAGDGRIAITDDPLEYLAFQRGWLKGRGINPEKARILTARGDSMEETIRDGDVLLIDTSIDRIKDNAIYIVVYGDMVLVKRVHGRINGSLQLISDNPRYPPEEVSAGEVDQLNIAGRVMWFGRTI
mgnify:CR=1 FL=1